MPILAMHLCISQNQLPIPGVKVTYFGKSEKVLTGVFSTFIIKSLENDTYNVIGKLNLMKI